MVNQKNKSFAFDSTAVCLIALDSPNTFLLKIVALLSHWKQFSLQSFCILAMIFYTDILATTDQSSCDDWKF